jgi:Tfp pilus assembly protein PilF
VALALCAFLFFLLWKRGERVSFGFVWFFVNIAPVLNARWIGPNVFTERYLYLPSVGLCWLAAYEILQIWNLLAAGPRARRMAFAGLLGVMAALGFARIVWRNRDWSDDATYYQVTLAAAPEAASLRLNLGAVYWNHRHPAEAETEWRKALVASPDSAPLLNNLGLVEAGKKHYPEAIDYFRRSMRLRPNYTDAHLNLGRVYATLGRSAEAELQLQTAVALAPLSVATRNELGGFYLAAGRLEDAETQLRASVASIPNAGAFDSLGAIESRLGHRDTAARAFQQAIALDALDSRAHFGLAAIFEAEGRAAQAAEQYQAGLSSDPLNPEAKAALRRLKSGSLHGDSSQPQD